MSKDLKFLVVDGFSTLRRIIKNLLSDLGYANVTEAADGQSALPLLKAGDFDFLVTDWNMPGMPGLEVLKQVRADARLAKLAVLMLTAAAKREQIIEAAQFGMLLEKLDGFLLDTGSDMEAVRANQERELVIEGMISIAQCENPRNIEAKLQGYLH